MRMCKSKRAPRSESGLHAQQVARTISAFAGWPRFTRRSPRPERIRPEGARRDGPSCRARLAKPAPSSRNIALDNLRVVAMLLGLVTHGVLPYTATGVAQFPIRDHTRHPIADAIYFAVHDFRMQLFFLLAGFAGTALASRRSVAGLVRNRLTRVALPLAFAVVVISPAMHLLFAHHTTGRGQDWLRERFGRLDRAELPPLVPLLPPALLRAAGARARGRASRSRAPPGNVRPGRALVHPPLVDRSPRSRSLRFRCSGTCRPGGSIRPRAGYRT